MASIQSLATETIERIFEEIVSYQIDPIHGICERDPITQSSLVSLSTTCKALQVSAQRVLARDLTLSSNEIAARISESGLTRRYPIWNVKVYAKDKSVDVEELYETAWKVLDEAKSVKKLTLFCLGQKGVKLLQARGLKGERLFLRVISPSVH